MSKCANQDKNVSMCNCTASCSKKGMCCECLAYHRGEGQLPACFFSKEAEATWDRSIEHFIRCNS